MAIVSQFVHVCEHKFRANSIPTYLHMVLMKYVAKCAVDDHHTFMAHGTLIRHVLGNIFYYYFLKFTERVGGRESQKSNEAIPA